jgi:hypothetical protein
VGKKSFDERRMLRLDGQKPTRRELWTAFYRLYRIAMGRGAYQDMAAEECFHVLMSGGRMIALVGAAKSSVSRVTYPTVVRRQLLKSERKRRLHGRFWEWLDTDKRVARQLCERGLETTPIEVAEVRSKVIRMIREKAAAENIRVPADDRELIRRLAAARG